MTTKKTIDAKKVAKPIGKKTTAVKKALKPEILNGVPDIRRFFYKNEIPADIQDKELKRYITEELTYGHA